MNYLEFLMAIKDFDGQMKKHGDVVPVFGIFYLHQY